MGVNQQHNPILRPQQKNIKILPFAIVLLIHEIKSLIVRMGSIELREEWKQAHIETKLRVSRRVRSWARIDSAA